jgi:hypothetical protein
MLFFNLKEIFLLKLNSKIMKRKFKLSALLLLASMGIFAAAPAKPRNPYAPSIKSMVTFCALPSKRGVEIKLNENAPDKAFVRIYNWNNDVVWMDKLSPKKGMDKGFILSFLDNGNYTIEVTLNDQTVSKTAHVYYRGDTKFVTLRG